MSPIAPKLLQKRLKIGMGVTEAAAIQACEEACQAVGFAVVARADNYLVLLPMPSQSLLNCIVPGPSLPVLQNPAAGHGVCAEIVPSSSCDGRLTLSVAGDRAGKGKAFVSELRARLRVSAHRARSTGAADAAVALLPVDSKKPSTVLSSMLTMEMRADAPGYYAISRLLCDHDQGSVGAVAADFVDAFSNCYMAACSRAPSATVDEGDQGAGYGTPIAEVMDSARQICSLASEALAKPATADAVFAAAEMGRLARFDAGTRLRIAVDRYLFARVGPTIWHYYISQHADADAMYVRKIKALRTVPDATLLRELEVHPAFCGVIARNARAHTDGSKSENFVEDTVKEQEVDTPRIGETRSVGPNSSFERAVTSLSRVEQLLTGGLGSTPWEAIEALAMAHCEMKTCWLEAAGGSSDVSSMDDILPVFNFILVRSSIVHPAACAHLMSDALTAEEQVSDVGKMVTLMCAAARYVTNAWNIDSFSEYIEDAVH